MPLPTIAVLLFDLCEKVIVYDEFVLVKYVCAISLGVQGPKYNVTITSTSIRLVRLAGEEHG